MLCIYKSSLPCLHTLFTCHFWPGSRHWGEATSIFFVQKRMSFWPRYLIMSFRWVNTFHAWAAIAANTLAKNPIMHCTPAVTFSSFSSQPRLQCNIQGLERDELKTLVYRRDQSFSRISFLMWTFDRVSEEDKILEVRFVLKEFVLKVDYKSWHCLTGCKASTSSVAREQNTQELRLSLSLEFIFLSNKEFNRWE